MSSSRNGAVLAGILIRMALATPMPAHGIQELTGEPVHLRVLQAAFPSARVSRSTAAPFDMSIKPDCCKEFPLDDTLKNERPYEVVAPASKFEEDPASDVAEPEKGLSNRRVVRLKVYEVHRQNGGASFLVSILNYGFLGAHPPNCCQSIGLVLLLPVSGDRVLDRFDEMPHAFRMFTSIRFLDVDGSGMEKLLISTDYSSPGEVGITFRVLDVFRERIHLLLDIPLASSWPQKYVLTLNESETIAAYGKHFHFAKKTYAEKGFALNPPAVTHVSYLVKQ